MKYWSRGRAQRVTIKLRFPIPIVETETYLVLIDEPILSVEP